MCIRDREEAWGTGTAAVISPIGEMGWKDKHVVVNGGEIGSLTQKLYDTLTGIQWGVEPDPYGWTVKPVSYTHLDVYKRQIFT